MNRINLIILACVLVSVVVWIADSDGLNTGFLAFSTNNLLSGKVWTLVTSLFLHADILHLGGNMIFLYAFGNALEKEVGAGKTLLAFFLGGILALLFGVLYYPLDAYLVGASAEIFTLAAVVMLVKPLKFSFLFFMPLGLVALIYIIYNVIAVQNGWEGNVAYFSHVVGFAVGIPLGMKWTKHLVRNLVVTLGLLVLYFFTALVLVPYLLGLLGV